MRSLVHPKERIYFALAVVVSLVIYAFLILSKVGIVYIIAGAMLSLVLHGMLVGHFRGNAIRVSENQFPEVNAMVNQLAAELQLKSIPAVYVQQAGGVLNAFATKFLGRSFVVLYSDVVEVARRQGDAALAFVVAHELAHHKRGHTGWKRILTTPAQMIPFLGGAYSRACEYTCDAFGAYARPDGAADGLLVLAAGKRLYRDVNLSAYVAQGETETGFWISFAEALSSHPNLPKRVKAVQARLSRTLPSQSRSFDRPSEFGSTAGV